MALNCKKYERTNKTVLGTVRELAGKGGKLKFIPRNLADESKRVTIIVELKDETSDIVIASKELSKRIRAKEIKLSQIAALNVTEEISVSGAIINVVNMPANAAGLITINADDVAPAYQPAETFVPEDLVAF
jgi:hypothetical protein